MAFNQKPIPGATRLSAAKAAQLVIRPVFSAVEAEAAPGVYFPRKREWVNTPNRWTLGWSNRLRRWVGYSWSPRQKCHRGLVFRTKEAMSSYAEFLSRHDWDVEGSIGAS